MIFPGTDAPAGLGDLEAEYELLGELGRGGMAVVYHGRERATGREVAIKVLRGTHGDAAEAQARFAREAETAALLQHPHIVPTYAVRPLSGGALAIVMEFIPGRNLKAVVREGGPLGVAEAVRVMREIADALAYAHERGVVHRDVKPENIFLDARTGGALLSDFGIARTLQHDAALTQTGIAIGTPSYMSPEQIDGRVVDGRSDVYSLGLVGWETLTGRQPWEGESLYAVIYKQKHEELPPLSDFRHDVPDDLRYVIERCLLKDRDARWQSAAALASALAEGPDAAAVREWRARRSRRIRPELAAALEREAVGSDTVRFRRPDAEEAVDEAMARELADADATRRRRRRVAAVAAALLLLAGGSVVAVRARQGASIDALEPALPGVTHTESGRRVESRPGNVGNTGAGDSESMAAAPMSIAADSAGPVAAAGTVATGSTGDVGSVAVPFVGGGDTALRRGAAPGAPTRSATPPRADARFITPSPIFSAPSAVATTPAPVTDAAPAAPALAARPSLALGFARAPIAAGGRHTCILGARGEALCFGGNDRGQLGEGDTSPELSPTRVIGAFQVVALAAGTSHSCAVARDGGIYCWGANDRGQLGDATTAPRDAPVRVAANADFRAVSLGASHSCALTRGGDVYCWGSNARGQLGDGTTTDHLVPTPVEAGGRHFTALALGWNHSCALDDSGQAYCWGEGSAGQLGDGMRAGHATPTRVAGGVAFMSITAGAAHSCALTAHGDAYCWGRNSFGQLGVGRAGGDFGSPSRVPSPVAFTALSAGGVHTCALARGGDAYCWGRNTYGQLGDGSNADSPTPTKVVGGYTFVYINASGAHSCAATAGGESLCWGYNIEGQLGDGTRTHRSRPVRVGG